MEGEKWSGLLAFIFRPPFLPALRREARGLPLSVEMPHLAKAIPTLPTLSPLNKTSDHMLSVHEARDATRPNQLRHLWHSLWSRTPRASFRQTPEFLEEFLPDLQSTSGRWRFLIVSAWQTPIGIVPFREHTVQRAFGSTRVLSVPESPWGDYPGPVGPHPATTLTAVVQYLQQHDDSWDVLELPEVAANGVEPTRVTQALNSHRTVVRKSQRELLGLELPVSFGQFWADRDAAARQRWRDLEAQRSIRRDEQFIRFRPGGAFHGDTERDWEFLGQLERVVRLQEGTPHTAHSRELFEQLRSTHALAVDAGCADVSLWLSDSRPAAFAYNFHCRSRVETALLLADPNISHATDRLIGMMLRDEIARGDSWHLFLPNSVHGTSVNQHLWQPIELCETTVTHDRRTTIHSRLQRWLAGDRRVTSTSRC